jgi:hypothetical protein
MAIQQLPRAQNPGQTQAAASPSPAAAAAGGGGGLPAWVEVLKTAAEKAIDPATIEGLSPSSALQVTPATFQSIEQEGRWKPDDILDDKSKAGRPLGIKLSSGSGQTYNIGQSKETAYGSITRSFEYIVSITCTSGSQVYIGVTWWSDGLEIYAGLAGMYSSAGFGSVYSDTASISLQAIPLGNYYPAQALITWTGWVNPAGPDYWEFLGAFGVSATGKISQSIQPMMLAWQRGKKPSFLKWSSKNGFELVVSSVWPSNLNQFFGTVARGGGGSSAG